MESDEVAALEIRTLADELVEGLDYTLDECGRFIFTAAYLLRRGRCCGSGCRNCPYGGKPLPAQQTCGLDEKLT